MAKIQAKTRTDFQKKVFSMTKKIPKGKVTTYKMIAKKLKTKAYRAIGNSLNKNNDKRVPCHRVVKSNGEIGGFNKGQTEKIKILEKEGIKVSNGRIIDFYKKLHTFS